MLYETKTTLTVERQTESTNIFAMGTTITTPNLIHKPHVHIHDIIPAPPISNGYNDLLIQTAQACPKNYEVFFIPKASGGLREITAPNEELKKQQTDLLHWLSALLTPPHPAVHSYLPEHSALTEMQAHQNNNSRWFLKCDIKDFFPSISPELIKNQLMKQYSFATNAKAADFLTLLDILAYYAGGLPQGAPTSPFLSNFALYEFDHKLTTALEEIDNQELS